MTRCAYCGRDPAEGYAFIDDDRYCHGDGPGTTCYERATRRQALDDLSVESHRLGLRY